MYARYSSLPNTVLECVSEDDNFKAFETINHGREIHETRCKVETLIGARVISSSHHRPFVSPSRHVRTLISRTCFWIQMKAISLDYLRPRCKIVCDRFARVPKHSLGDFEARFIACIIMPVSKHASWHHFSTSNFSDSHPICINAIFKREVMHHVIKNACILCNDLLV